MSNESTILKKIRSGGYWRVIFVPDYYDPNKFELSKCKQIIEDCQVKIRDRPYPFINSKKDLIVTNRNYIENQTEDERQLEAWRFYCSGQFIHYFAFPEERIPTFIGKKILEPKILLEILNEIIIFVFNLEESAFFNGPMTLTITLFDCKNRKLTFQHSLSDLDDNFLCKEESIELEMRFTEDEISYKFTSKPRELAYEILQKFGWYGRDLKTFIIKEQELIHNKQFRTASSS